MLLPTARAPGPPQLTVLPLFLEGGKGKGDKISLGQVELSYWLYDWQSRVPSSLLVEDMIKLVI